MDFWVVASSGLGLGVFAVSHVIAFRYFKPSGFARAFLACFLIGMAAAVATWDWAVFSGGVGPQSSSALALGGGIVVILCGLMFLLFLSWIFGVGESSIRIRILREIDRHREEGASLGEIESCYNDRMLLNVRLSRLAGSGQLKFDGRRYHWNGSALMACQLRVIDALCWALRGSTRP